MSHRTKKYTLASRTGQRLNQSLQESIFFSYPRKIIFKNLHPKEKIFKTPTHSANTTGQSIEC